jgi:outer membrane protein assembly factor BamB
MRIHRTYLIALTCVLAGGVMWGQGRNIGLEWPATQGDAQRTAWLRSDPNISVANLNRPGFELLWQEKLDNQPRHVYSLSQGVTMNGLLGFSPASFVTGVSNNLFALDNDTGFPLWHRRFDSPLPSAATAACPGGLTGAAGRVVTAELLPIPAPAAGGRGGRGGYRGTVGQPGEGIPPEFTSRAGGAAPAARGGQASAGPGPATPAAPGQPAPPAQPAGPGRAGAPAAAGGARGAPGAPGAPAAGRGGGGVAAGRYAGPVYAVSTDGMLHSLGQISGLDVQGAVPFIPANARYSDLVAVGEVLYTMTSQGCGNAPNAVWAITLDAENKTVSSWRTNGGNPVGNIAFLPDGTLIVAIGAGQVAGDGRANAIVALDPKTLQPRDWFTDPSADFTTTPMVFRHDDRTLVAAATRDGRILLLDSASLGGPNHSTPLYASNSLGGSFAPDALATWQEMTPGPAAAAAPAAPGAAAPGAGAAPAPAAQTMMPGQRWLLVSVTGRLPAGVTATNGAVTNGAVVAFKVTSQGGRPSLQPGWTSRDLALPTAPIVANNVVFAASSGRPQAGPNASASDLARRGTPGVLYAFDGMTGRELWNSAALKSWVPANSIWASNSQVHVGAYDGTVTAFGFALERRPY